MTDNLFFLFLDEIYTPNINEFLRLKKEEIFSKKNHFHFGIAGVAVPACCLKDINFASRRIKSKYYPNNQTVVFHYVDILNERDSFLDLHRDHKKKDSLVKSLSSFVSNADFRYSCVFVDKHELIKKFGIFDSEGRLVKIKKIGSNLFPRSSVLDYNLYLLCLKRIMSSFYKYITSRNIKARGIVVAEARGKREDTEIREAFHKIHCHGIGSISPKEIRSIILDLYIVPKFQNYIGTQIADLVLYPTYDGLIPSHNIRDDHFISFDKILEMKMITKTDVLFP